MSRLLRRFAENSRVLLTVSADGEGRVTSANQAFAQAVGLDPEKLHGRSLQEFVPDHGGSTLEKLLAGERMDVPDLISLMDKDGHPFTIEAIGDRDVEGMSLVGTPPEDESRKLSNHLQRMNNELSTLAREHARQEREYRRTAERLQATLEELDRSYWHLKKIQEAIPVCMQCSRIKGSESGWQSLMDYLRENEIFMSHGYCPSCAREVLREEDRDLVRDGDGESDEKDGASADAES